MMTDYSNIKKLSVPDRLQYILRTSAQARRTMRRWLDTLRTPEDGVSRLRKAQQADPAPRREPPDINKLLRARPVDGRRGSPMGAASYDNRTGWERVYCQRVRFIDGDYAPDGTYCGGGEPLYVIFTEDLALCWYVRAKYRRHAVEAYMRDNPRAKEFGSPKV